MAWVVDWVGRQNLFCGVGAGCQEEVVADMIKRFEIYAVQLLSPVHLLSSGGLR